LDNISQQRDQIETNKKNDQIDISQQKWGRRHNLTNMFLVLKFICEIKIRQCPKL